MEAETRVETMGPWNASSYRTLKKQEQIFPPDLLKHWSYSYLHFSPAKLTLAYNCERITFSVLSHGICGHLLQQQQETEHFVHNHWECVNSAWPSPVKSLTTSFLHQPWPCPVSAPTHTLTLPSDMAFHLVVPSTWYSGLFLISLVPVWDLVWGLSWPHCYHLTLLCPLPHPWSSASRSISAFFYTLIPSKCNVFLFLLYFSWIVSLWPIRRFSRAELFCIVSWSLN